MWLVLARIPQVRETTLSLLGARVGNRQAQGSNCCDRRMYQLLPATLASLGLGLGLRV